MKRLWGSIGTGMFWILWPAWVVYFRISGVRSRVFVVCDDELLLVQGWLSTKKWSLPGGGSKRNEASVAAAVRELAEETGIKAAESSLRKLGSYKHTRYGFKYHGDLYCLSVPEKPELSIRKSEIWKAEWIRLNDVKSYQLDDEVKSALRRYRPPEQASLL